MLPTRLPGACAAYAPFLLLAAHSACMLALTRRTRCTLAAWAASLGALCLAQLVPDGVPSQPWNIAVLASVWCHACCAAVANTDAPRSPGCRTLGNPGASRVLWATFLACLPFACSAFEPAAVPAAFRSAAVLTILVGSLLCLTLSALAKPLHPPRPPLSGTAGIAAWLANLVSRSRHVRTPVVVAITLALSAIPVSIALLAPVSVRTLLPLVALVGACALLWVVDFLTWALLFAPSAAVAAIAIPPLHTAHLTPADIASTTTCVLSVSMALTGLLVRSYPPLTPAASDVSHAQLASSAAAGAVCTLCAAAGFGRPELAAFGLGLLACAALNVMPLAPILTTAFSNAWTSAPPPAPGSPEHLRRTAARFVHLAPSVRFYVLSKLRFDPLFPTLLPLVPSRGHVLDIGCGIGLTAAWLATIHPELTFTALDVLPERVRLATYALDRRGHARVHACDDLADPNRPEWTLGPFDTVLCVDVIHHLEHLGPVLSAAYQSLRPGGKLVLRGAVVRTSDTWLAKCVQAIERLVVFARRQPFAGYRSESEIAAAIHEAGFACLRIQPSPGSRPETWFVAQKAVGCADASSPCDTSL